MPRAARIDHSDLLQHVIVRGIEKNPIFFDDADRNAFLQRINFLLVETGTECLAWTLMRNHAHFLLRPRRDKLSTFMRRPLTGYAVTFNLRHRRTGHLFQNRYKSIVCEEEPYLLELVRYIHLNSLRAGTSKFLQSETKNWKRLERPESKNGRRKNVAPFSIIKSRQPDIFNPLTQQGQLSTSG